MAAAPDLPLVVDAHCDVAGAMLDRGIDLARRQRATHFDLVRARQGGLGAQVFALFVDPGRYRGEGAWRRARALLGAVEAAAGAHPRRLGLARTAGEIRALRAQGRLAALLGLEGAHAFGAARERTLLARLRGLARRGLSYLTLTWNNSNALAGAAADRGGGLTPLGRRVVRECERLGVLVDVSHASDATVRDLLACARRPLLASHSNARALCAVPRNLPDDLAREIGAAGGVVCVNFFPGFLDEAVAAELERRFEAGRERWRALERRLAGDARALALAERRLAVASTRGVAPVPLARVLEHLEHLSAVAGPGAVGLGSDFDGMLLTPRGLEDVAALPRLARALARRLGTPATGAILGGNLLRLLDLPRAP